jgi:hypothetical protein
MARPLRSEDEGKQIVGPDGMVIGSIAAVEDERAYVRPKSGLMEGWSSWICGPQCEEKSFPLDNGAVLDVTDGTVVVEPREASAAVAGEK